MSSKLPALTRTPEPSGRIAASSAGGGSVVTASVAAVDHSAPPSSELANCTSEPELGRSRDHAATTRVPAPASAYGWVTLSGPIVRCGVHAVPVQWRTKSAGLPGVLLFSRTTGPAGPGASDGTSPSAMSGSACQAAGSLDAAPAGSRATLVAPASEPAT